MHLRLLSLYLLGATPLAAQAVANSDDDVVQRPGILQLPIVAPKNENNMNGNKTKRQVQVELQPDDLTRAYNIEFTLGTPGQKILIPFGTGFDIVWVREKPQVPVSPTSGEHFFFDKSRSTTLASLNKILPVIYLDNCSEYNLEFHKDTLSLGQ